MGGWNKYLGSLICLNREELFPSAVGPQHLPASFEEKLVLPYMMAVTASMIFPVVLIFFLAQRTFVEGITLTGMKG